MIIVKFQRGIIQKMWTRVMVLVVCTSSDDIFFISMKFHENILNGIHTKLPIIKFQRE